MRAVDFQVSHLLQPFQGRRTSSRQGTVPGADLRQLYRELICGNDYKRCQSCGSRFYSKARNKRYCDKCAERIKRQKAAERKRRQRERQKQLLYINN